MNKMAVMPIYGKNLLLWNQKANDLETWYKYASSVARILPSLLKWWPWVNLDLYYGKVKFGPLCFCMGNLYEFFRNYCRLWFETSIRRPKWHEISVDMKTYMYKIRLQRYFLKPATTEWNDKTFLLISKLCPLGAVCPCPGLYTCTKSWKKCIKSDFKEISLKLTTNG